MSLVHDFIFNSAFDDQGDLIGCFTEKVLKLWSMEHKLCHILPGILTLVEPFEG